MDKQQIIENARILGRACNSLMLNAMCVDFIIGQRRRESLIKSYDAIAKNYESYKSKAIHEFAPNNWLKMHGYPMRRKIKR